MFWAIVFLVLGTLGYRHLRGSDLRDFDRPCGQWFDTTAEEADEIRAVEARISELLRPGADSKDWRSRLATSRAMADGLSDALVFDGRVESIDIGQVSAEWVVAEGADTARRVLLMHGGAFAIGSARGHRKLSAKLSELANAAVLAVDYRLWPEFHRRDAMRDCREAWRFMLGNGPDGSGDASYTMLAGDSAGGNLALGMAAWLRDQKNVGAGAAQADAVIAICPTVDSTLSGPSIRYNASTDIIIGSVGRLVKRFSHPVYLIAATALYRMRLSSPENSPVFGPLHGLPPTLIHTSDHDILFSDSIRYTNKARRDGSPVTLQVWRGMQHDWHVFADELAATEQAYQAIGEFVDNQAQAQQ